MVASFVEHLETNMRGWVEEVEESGGRTITDSGRIHHVMVRSIPFFPRK